MVAWHCQRRPSYILPTAVLVVQSSIMCCRHVDCCSFACAVLSVALPGHLHVLMCILCVVCAVDHPFVASLYGTIQTGTHLHFLMEYCEGGELYGLLTTQPTKRLKEAHMRFYVAEVRLFSLHATGSLLPLRCPAFCLWHLVISNVIGLWATNPTTVKSDLPCIGIAFLVYLQSCQGLQ